jgi:stage IV sporulation protein FB
MSFRFLKILGIEIRIHATFLFLPLLIGGFYAMHYGWAVGARAFVLILLIFVCVLLHELSHSLVARHFGIRVPRITLYPMGGVASMQRIPRQSKQEFLISIVGPFSNFLIALLLFPILYFLIGPQSILSPSLDSWQGVLANLFWANPMLGAFNLIPAFPMDGGRILRSILASHLPYIKATQISVQVGQFFAILFALFGIWQKHWMLILIAIFVYGSASNEQKRVTYEEFLKVKRE